MRNSQIRLMAGLCALAMASSALAQSGTIGTTSPGFLQLVDGGWTYRVDNTSSTAARTGTGGGLANYVQPTSPARDHLFQHWWWYRGRFTDGSGAIHASLPCPTSTRQPASQVRYPALMLSVSSPTMNPWQGSRMRSAFAWYMPSTGLAPQVVFRGLAPPSCPSYGLSPTPRIARLRWTSSTTSIWMLWVRPAQQAATTVLASTSGTPAGQWAAGSSSGTPPPRPQHRVLHPAITRGLISPLQERISLVTRLRRGPAPDWA
jgi:hypothetical protein